MLVTAKTKRFAWLGQPVAPAYLPTLHNLCFARFNIDAVCVPAPLDALHLKEGMRILRDGWHGVGLCAPHSQMIAPFLDGLDTSALRAQRVVNAVINRNKELVGYNTEVGALLRALQTMGVALTGVSALVIGVGARAKTALTAMLLGGADTTICARSVVQASGLAYTVRSAGVMGTPRIVGGISALAGEIFDIIIYAHETPGVSAGCTKTMMRQAAVAVDMTQSLQPTAFSELAQQMKVASLDGLGVAVFETLETQQVWLGTTYDETQVRQALVHARAQLALDTFDNGTMLK